MQWMHLCKSLDARPSGSIAINPAGEVSWIAFISILAARVYRLLFARLQERTALNLLKPGPRLRVRFSAESLRALTSQDQQSAGWLECSFSNALRCISRQGDATHPQMS